MELTTLLPYMGILLCPIAMGLMMWMMHRNMGGSTDQAASSEQTPTARLAALREVVRGTAADRPGVLLPAFTHHPAGSRRPGWSSPRAAADPAATKSFRR